MKVQFKQAAHIEGRDYQLGIHAVPEKVLANKFFQRLAHAGLIVEVDEAKVAPTETVDERQKRFVQKIMSVSEKKSPTEAPLASNPEQASPPAQDQAASESPETEPVSAEEEAQAEVGGEVEAHDEKHERHAGKKNKSSKR